MVSAAASRCRRPVATAETGAGRPAGPASHHPDAAGSPASAASASARASTGTASAVRPSLSRRTTSTPARARAAVAVSAIAAMVAQKSNRSITSGVPSTGRRRRVAMKSAVGDGRVAAVAQDDIADAATAVLLDPDAHAGRVYSLTGPASLTLTEVAATIAAVTGRPVSYHEETVPEAYESRASYGAPDWEVDAWVSTYTAIAAGELATVTDDVRRLTGRPATSFAEVLRRSQ